MEEFALHSAITVREMDHFFRDMKEQFFKALHYFGEDPKGKDQSPMKFFGVFSKFLKSLSVIIMMMMIKMIIIINRRHTYTSLL